MDGSDPRLATHITKGVLATHSTNGISTQKLLINPSIQVIVGPITPLVTASVVGTCESLSPCQTVLLQANGSATPMDASCSETNSILSLQMPSFVVTSVSQAQFRDQDIVSPSPEPFDALINGSLDKNSDSTSFSSHVVGLEAVFGEVADVDTIERTNFLSSPVLGETPKFMDLRVSTINTADKLNSVFAPVSRAEGLTDHSEWLTSGHQFAEVTAERVSEAKAYINCIKNSDFETRNVFERENIQFT